MAEPVARPFPPGRYPVVVVGSGPGGLQTSYWLRDSGVDHAVISADEVPGGMFRRFPLFQRLISWTKPYAPADRGTPGYEWYDWNSLLAGRAEERAPLWEFMDGTSYFPARSEMEEALVAFSERAGVRVRYGCRWESTRREGDGFVLTTTDGEYRCRVVVFAIGMTEPWKPDIPGLDLVPHYVACRKPQDYAGKRIFIVGKRNSGFEVADGLLPAARQIVLGSPRPARFSILTHSTAGARARYIQPYEDHLLGGGTFVLDAAIERVARTADGFRVFTKGTTRPGDTVFDVDEVIAATGFQVPMRDLRALGVRTVNQDRLPAQTPFWESVSARGVHFAGGVSQGAVELRKYGMSSNSAAVHGFRYNARVLARYIARTYFGIEPERPTLRSQDVVPYLLSEAAHRGELWNQRSYLARVLSFDHEHGIVDEGIEPLAHFVDAPGPDAVAITMETDESGDHHPAVYCRRSGRVDEHRLASEPLLDFETAEHRKELTGILGGLLGVPARTG